LPGGDNLGFSPATSPRTCQITPPNRHIQVNSQTFFGEVGTVDYLAVSAKSYFPPIVPPVYRWGTGGVLAANPFICGKIRGGAAHVAEQKKGARGQ
jgi:hypothetical protein